MAQHQLRHRIAACIRSISDLYPHTLSVSRIYVIYSDSGPDYQPQIPLRRRIYYLLIHLSS